VRRSASSKHPPRVLRIFVGEDLSRLVDTWVLKEFELNVVSFAKCHDWAEVGVVNTGVLYTLGVKVSHPAP
jgi:hypothetical protein